MSIVSFNVQAPMLQGIAPRIVQIVTTDNLATITAAGYFNKQGQILQGLNFIPTDELHIIYSYVASTNSGTFGIFTPSIASNGTITISQWVDAANVLLPVVSGDFAIFNGTAGQIKDAGYLPSNAAKTNVVMANGATVANHIAAYTDAAGTIGVDPATAINGGNIQAGLSGTAGTVASFPGTAANGSLVLAAINAGGAFNTTISNSVMGQSSVISIPDPGAATSKFVLSQSSAATNNVAFTKVITATFTQLAAAGKVNVVVHPSATSQFAILDIKVLKSTGLSGGGGDRLLSVSDGTIAFNSTGITAALLGTPILTVWGGAGNPLATGASEVSTAGADIFLQYIGGTTDYTAGSVQLAITFVQVTA